jgi:cytochrome bd ubiquinol oxidase subunit I
MEGLLAFFAESTFIALWMFGRDRLSPLAHTLSICVVSLGTIVSAFFILTANGCMQHPVGYRIVGGKAELTDFWTVLRNDKLWVEFSHTVLAAFVTGAMVVLGVSAWQLLRGLHTAHTANVSSRTTTNSRCGTISQAEVTADRV